MSTVTYVPCDGQGFVSPDDVRAAMRPNTRLVAVESRVERHRRDSADRTKSAASCAKRDALFLVDAAQSLGHVPIDVRTFEVDLLAAPGHKGLLGPLGTGVLYIRPGVERELKPLRCGGTGTQSDEDRQPDVLPDKYEPGNHNLPGLAGLAAATEFLRDETDRSDPRPSHRLAPTAARRASRDRRRHHPRPADGGRSHQRRQHHRRRLRSAGAGRDARIDATASNAAPACTVRPRMHEALGTTAGGGTLRFSPGYSTTLEEIDTVITALQEVASRRRSNRSD